MKQNIIFAGSVFILLVIAIVVFTQQQFNSNREQGNANSSPTSSIVSNASSEASFNPTSDETKSDTKQDNTTISESVKRIQNLVIEIEDGKSADG